MPFEGSLFFVFLLCVFLSFLGPGFPLSYTTETPFKVAGMASVQLHQCSWQEDLALTLPLL